MTISDPPFQPGQTVRWAPELAEHGFDVDKDLTVVSVDRQGADHWRIEVMDGDGIRGVSSNEAGEHGLVPG